MRLFLGLPIPPELAQALTRLTRTIELPKGRRTAPENLHLTLVFLGEVAEPTLPSIEHELAELNFAPFPLKLTSLNTFPRAGVVVAEVEPTHPLLHLQAKVAAATARCGFHPKDPEDQEVRQRSFRADTVNLYRSHLTPTGSHYEILAQKKSTKPDEPITHP